MVRRLAYIVCLLLLCNILTAGNKYALTVFISDYPQESGWNTINSSNDKSLILPLLKEMGFTESGIICLEDKEATHSNILASFDKLAQKVSKGDEVYIHFSCHGQQISDVDGDEAMVNSKDKYDEALVPYDAYISYDWNGYKGDRHLLDDTINEWLSFLSNAVGKEGIVLFVADACHSGDLKRTKGVENNPEFRGTFDTFRLPLPVVKTNRSSYDLNWVSLSACKEFQTNYECMADGVKYGRLSYAISQCIKKDMTVTELVAALEDKYVQIPLPKGKAQTLSVECPKNILQKTLFR